jgi:hypothetical protein
MKDPSEKSTSQYENKLVHDLLNDEEEEGISISAILSSHAPG